MNAIIMTAVTTIAALSGMFLLQPKQEISQKPTVHRALPDTIRKTPLPPPELIVRTDGGRQKAMKIDSFDVQISVIGNIARTTLTMVFRNENNVVLEGELSVPLDEGQTIRRFAMDINGKLREGVPVEKQQARAVFESTVRKNIDPGIIELTRGNTFRTRVYPIPSKGTKTVVVGYDQELPAFNDRLEYVLPFVFKEALPVFTLHAEVAGMTTPDIEEPTTGERFSREDDGFALAVRRTNYTPAKPFAFSVPTGGSRAFVAEQNGVRYFYVFSAKEGQTTPKPLPRSITLVWDASGSAAKRQIDKEFAVLSAYFEKLGSCDITAVILRNVVEEPRRFSVSGGKWDALREYLRSQPFDGATHLGALNVQQYRTDEILMFTDGIGNLGKREITLGTTPVFAINSAPDAEYSYLRYIAQTTGGAYINLLSAETDEAVEALTTRQLTLLSVTSTSGSADIVPSMPAPVPSGGIGIAGKLPGGAATLTLHYGYGRHEEFTETVMVSARDNAASADFLGNIHAAKKIAELDMRYDQNKPEITRLGKEFSIVTRNTSLIVLDAVEDYVRHEIMPPDELRDEYNRLISQKKTDKLTTDSSHFAEVLRMFKERKEWYDAKFPLPSVKKDEEVAMFAADDAVAGNADAVNPAPRSSGRLSEMSVSSGMGYAVGRASVGSFAAGGQPPPPMGMAKAAAEESATITLEAWDPKTPYMEQLKKATQQEAYAEYLKLKEQYGATAGFYLDAADYFLTIGQKELSLRILSNIAEMDLENAQLLRVLGHRLQQLGYSGLAVSVFRDVLEMRGEEPQSYRDLGLALAADGKPQEASDMLYSVVNRSWDGRFPEIELLVLGELNHIIATSGNALRTDKYDKRLLAAMPLDVRVVLTWDTDNCDMDLWVTDPKGEKCFYQYRDTRIGGHISHDLTGGYGPEEFLLKKALPGKYKVQVNYYGSMSQKVSGPTTIQVRLFTRYATGREEKKDITMRLKDVKEVINVGEFEFAAK